MDGVLQRDAHKQRLAEEVRRKCCQETSNYVTLQQVSRKTPLNRCVRLWIICTALFRFSF